MWDEDWALLGIEPTTELAAIKKAYALKLKVTRPDDDAQAYQALRAAYERAQQWAKHQAEDADAAPVALVSTLPPAAGASAALTVEVAAVPPSSAEEALPLEEPAVQPSQLIEALELCWHRDGVTGLMAGWALASREIDRQPLSRHTVFSATFAEWVLSLPALPDAFIKAVDAYFGWLTDFRTERQLGAPLTHALHETLGERLRQLPLDPALLAIAAPLRGMADLRASGASRWRLQWLFFLLQPLLARCHGTLESAWLRRLGLDAEAQGWLALGINHGLWLRVALVSAVVAVADWAIHGDVEHLAGVLWVWFMASATLMRGALLLAGILQPQPGRALVRWRRREFQPWLAIVWLLFAAWLAYLDATTLTGPMAAPLALLPGWVLILALAGFAVAGLAVGWPPGLLHSSVAIGLAPLVGYFFMVLLQAWLPPPAAVLIGMAWLLFAVAVHEQRLSPPAPVLWLLRPVLNSLALADRWTPAVALFPVAASLAVATLSGGNASPLRLFVTWVLSILMVAWLQAQAEAWGLKRLAVVDAETA